jgi:hypothetical protein
VSTPAPGGMESHTTYYRSRRPRRSTRALTVRTAVVSGVATLLIGTGLAWQMAQGADPALAPKAQADAPAEQRVVRTVVIRRVPSLTPSSSGSTSSGSPAASAVTQPPRLPRSRPALPERGRRWGKLGA